jgi:DNA-directed RNA polymerase subunit M/transcription elongation factor TFIIS
VEPSSTIGSIPESKVAEPVQESVVQPTIVLEDTESSEERQSAIRFCPVCRHYLYLQSTPNTLERLCRNCGYNEQDEKGGLVMELMIQERSAEGYKILLNEFTRKDARLPHIRKNIACPDATCPSNHGAAEPDVIYIKYDAVNLLYLYICDVCGFQWRSRR